MEFAKGKLLFVIEVKPGQGCMVEEYSAYPTEKEIILPTFCKFRIKNIKSTTELKWLVELECLYVDRQMYDTGQQSIIVDQNDEK